MGARSSPARTAYVPPQISSCFSVPFRGWSVESRVYAEDPMKGYLPSIGRLSRYTEPAARGEDVLLGNRVRCDSGIREGDEVSMHYHRSHLTGDG